MKVKNFVVAGALAVMSVLGVGLGAGSAMAAVSCPKGSALGEGASANTYAECNIDTTGQPELWKTVQTILNVIVGCIGIVAVAVIILGGVTFVTSQGDAAKVTKAKNTIIYGVVGLIIAILAFSIVNFILSSVFSA